MGEIRRFYIDFLHRPLEEYQKFTAYTSRGVGGGGGGFQCFGDVICLPRKKQTWRTRTLLGFIAIYEMFRRLRSAKLSHVEDTFIGK